MGSLDVDPLALDGAGASVVSVGRDLGSATSTLTSALGGTGGMCGDDPAGAALARQYDSSAKALIEAMTQIRNGLVRIGDGVRMSAANYSAAEAGSNLAGGAEPLPRPALTDLITAGSVPSGGGTGTPAPPGWGWVAPFIGMIWPTADSGRLRAAAAAWTAAGTQFLATEVGAAVPLGIVGAQHIPEADAIGAAFATAARGGSQILQQCATIATALTTYAAHVDEVHAAILDLLSQVADPMTGIKIVWDFLTGDDENEIERIANEIRTVIDNFKAEVTALGHQIAGLAAEAAIAATSMGRYAEKEWDHFLHETATGRALNQFGQFENGAWEEAGGMLKDLLWTYSDTRKAIDPQGYHRDLEALGRGLAPLVGLGGGPDAPGVGHAWKEFGKQAVHWDEWTTNPAEAAGRSVVDVATLALPVAGEEATAVRTTMRAADAAADAARVERPLENLPLPKPPRRCPSRPRLCTRRPRGCTRRPRLRRDSRPPMRNFPLRRVGRSHRHPLRRAHCRKLNGYRRCR